jgi:hypothetical protein
MENTGEATEYLALSRGCGPCRKLAARVDSYYKAGGYVRWGGWRIISVKHYAGGQTLQFAVHSNSRPTKYRASSSSPVQRFSGGSITYVLALKRANHSWVVTNKSELES